MYFILLASGSCVDFCNLKNLTLTMKVLWKMEMICFLGKRDILKQRNNRLTHFMSLISFFTP